jgi:hypothetical chaperone protein
VTRSAEGHQCGDASEARTVFLGIDFGTSNSAAALVKADGVLQVMQLEATRAEMPTAVFFASETHTVLFGGAAMAAYLAGTEGRLLRSLKSLLGSQLMDESTVVNGQALRFFDIVVLFLQELKRRCEAQAGCALTHAVLGRPVHFVDEDPESDQLAQDTLGRAARHVGFTDVRFALEPVAAALDFAQRIEHETRTLVVDIGGGTSDFTVMRLQPRQGADILATTGVHIGGTDFDRLLDLAVVMPLLGYRHIGRGGRPVPNSVFFDLSTWHLIHRCYTRKAMAFAQELWTDYTDPTLHRRLMQALEEQQGHRMLSAIEAAKINCSLSGADAAVALDFLESSPSTNIDVNVDVKISVNDMAQALEAAVGQVVRCALECVAQSGLPGVDVVYLTGGSSAMRPLMQALQTAMPQATMVQGNRFGGVAAGLAYAGLQTGVENSRTGNSLWTTCHQPRSA